MPKRRSIDDLSVEELRQLLIEKRRSQRNKRIDYYRRTGRVILVESAPTPSALESLRSVPLDSSPLLTEDGQAAPPSRLRAFLDRFLFLIEVAAVIGLAYVVLNGVNILRSLNSEVAQVLEQQQPTPSPTPIISAVVLPSGHTPPNPENGVTKFNEDEIPEHLRPLVQSMTAAFVLPTPAPEHAQNIKIPTISIFAPVVWGDGWEQLKKGVGQMVNTPNPGQEGNIVLSAHNDVFGEIFRDLDKLKPGDEVILYTQLRAYTYVVRQTQIVEETQVEVLGPTREAVITLISCYPYLVDDKRIVVRAELVK